MDKRGINISIWLLALALAQTNSLRVYIGAFSFLNDRLLAHVQTFNVEQRKQMDPFGLPTTIRVN